MLNVVAIMGRLTADPELRKTPNGISVCSFSIACNRSYVKQGGERETDFVNIVAWRSTAEFICRYFRKGNMIAINGSIQTRNYEDKNGNKRKAVEILVDNASFCGSKAETGTGGYSAPEAPAAPAPSFTSGSESDFEEISEDDDLPF